MCCYFLQEKTQSGITDIQLKEFPLNLGAMENTVLSNHHHHILEKVHDMDLLLHYLFHLYCAICMQVYLEMGAILNKK